MCTPNKSTSLLPPFPNVHNITFSQPFPIEKVSPSSILAGSVCGIPEVNELHIV